MYHLLIICISILNQRNPCWRYFHNFVLTFTLTSEPFTISSAAFVSSYIYRLFLCYFIYTNHRFYLTFMPNIFSINALPLLIHLWNLFCLIIHLHARCRILFIRYNSHWLICLCFMLFCCWQIQSVSFFIHYFLIHNFYLHICTSPVF